jgi:hypothetical protein
MTDAGRRGGDGRSLERIRLPWIAGSGAAKRRRLPAAAGAAAEILPVGRHPLAEVSFVELSCDAFQGESEGAEHYGNFCC